MTGVFGHVEEKELELLALLLDRGEEDPKEVLDLDLSCFTEGPPRYLATWIQARLGWAKPVSRSAFEASSHFQENKELAGFVRSLPTALPDGPLGERVFSFQLSRENERLQKLLGQLENRHLLPPRQVRFYHRLVAARLDRLKAILVRGRVQDEELIVMRDRLWSLFEDLERGRWHGRLVRGLSIPGFRDAPSRALHPCFLLVEGQGRGTRLPEQYADFVVLEALREGEMGVLLCQEDSGQREQRLLAGGSRLSVRDVSRQRLPPDPVHQALAGGAVSLNKENLRVRPLPREAAELLAALHEDLSSMDRGLVVLHDLGWESIAIDPGIHTFMRSLRQAARSYEANMVLIFDRDEATGVRREDYSSQVVSSVEDSPVCRAGDWKSTRRIAATYADVAVRVGVRHDPASPGGVLPGLRLVKSPEGARPWREARWLVDPEIAVPDP